MRKFKVEWEEDRHYSVIEVDADGEFVQYVEEGYLSEREAQEAADRWNNMKPL